ncbi:hypothetical protein EDC04DRAFT_2609164 [Pisolithus marmoratus]|nr:hypothetical protein EDC04DRAFT_2609164 [Pisolithus marmoratus]
MLSPSPEGNDPPQSFSIFLIVYSKIRKTSARGKTTSKEENHTPQAWSGKLHMKSQRKALPPEICSTQGKGQWASDMIDVNNTADYREMVKKISEGKPAIVRILVDMQHIKRLPHPLKSSEDDLEFASDSMKKAYKNEQDKGLTYISMLGSIPLMPAMVHDWCLVLEDGQATITTPPNIESFNIANKAPILHLMCKAAMQAAQPASPAAVDLNSLTLAILLWMLTQFDSGLHPPTSPASPMPQTPAQN